MTKEVRPTLNIICCELQSCILVSIMHTHTHTLLYPSCTWTTLGTVFTNHSSAMDKSWIVSWWFSKTSSTICSVHMFLICQAERWYSSWWMPTHSWTPCILSLVSVHHHQTLALTGNEFQGWKCSAYINCHTTKFPAWQSFHYHYHCT
jgi:hypothetical protein